MADFIWNNTLRIPQLVVGYDAIEGRHVVRDLYTKNLEYSNKDKIRICTTKEVLEKINQTIEKIRGDMDFYTEFNCFEDIANSKIKYYEHIKWEIEDNEL